MSQDIELDTVQAIKKHILEQAKVRFIRKEAQ